MYAYPGSNPRFLLQELLNTEICHASPFVCYEITPDIVFTLTKAHFSLGDVLVRVTERSLVIL